MARLESRRWDGTVGAPSKADRRAGDYEVYLPDARMGSSVALAADTATLLATAEQELAALRSPDLTQGVGDLGALVVRAESYASSRIEGIPPRARLVAFAELAFDEPLSLPSRQAQWVANNVRVTKLAAGSVAEARQVTSEHILELQRELVEPHLRGLRTAQNWVGGSDWHPLDAAYVPPSADQVPRLIDDLAGYLNDVSVPPLVQAAIAHAQFETIHPFPDGNGRVGRALIHTVLSRRRALPRGMLLPISLVLLTRKDEYVDGLAQFRHLGPVGGAEAALATNAWLRVFLTSVIDAVDQARLIDAGLRALVAEWRQRLASRRAALGVSATPRTDSAVGVLLGALTSAPVMTLVTANRLYGLSATAAARAFGELEEAGITARRRDGRMSVHFAPELFDLLDAADRRLASPVFDTMVEPPVRPAVTRGVAAESAEPHAASTPPVADERSDEAVRHQAAFTEWSDRARSVWGKSNHEDQGFLSLVRHLEDSAAVAGALWDDWLSENVKRVIAGDLPMGEEDGRLLLVWLAGLHDIGKATPGFAVKADFSPGNGHLLAAMADCGLIAPAYTRGGGERLPPHCHLGHFVLATYLIDRFGVGSFAAAALASPVGTHHGVPPSEHELSTYRGSRWTGRRDQSWREVQAEIIEGMSDRVGATDRLQHWLAHPPTEFSQALLTAAVVVADWLASDTNRFPHDDFSSAADRLTRADLDRSLRGPWRPPAAVADASEQLARRFPVIAEHGIRPLQQVARDVAARQRTAPLIVIEAPMGSGKTEAALLAAEELARTFGCGGVFVGLPSMATSDAMFARVLEWTRHLGGNGADAAKTMFLAHGKSWLNEDYHVLVRESRVRDINVGEGDDGVEEAVVSSWLQGRRKGVLANMVIGTIDQALFGALKVRHLALRHLALAGKVVIIDEVHAADDYMRTYLHRVLEWLGGYGTPVVLLSATLPPQHLSDLTAAYARGRKSPQIASSAPAAYPRITVQADRGEQVAVAWTGGSTEVDLLAIPDDLEATVDRVAALVEAGCCVVVVRNTVRRAQHTYQGMVDRVGAARASLLHSQFIASERAAKEARLRRMLGPTGPGVQRPNGHVVVGTQVLEQSLDIDADVMVSDHAPVDLLLQRIGRLHRHQRGAGQSRRPEIARRARLYVTGLPRNDEPPVLEPGSAAVYGVSSLLRSATVLAPHAAGHPIVLPRDVPSLVALAYEPDLTPPQGWEAEWAAAEDVAFRETAARRARARDFRLGQPWHSPSLVGWLDMRTSESGGDEESVSARAQVRDGEDSVEVLVVQRDGDGVYRILPGDHRHAGADLGVVQQAPPPDHLALSVLASSVRLPHQLARAGRLDSVIEELEVAGWQFSGWQRSRWLQKQLVLCLDADLSTVLAGRRIRYDSELGLLVEGKVSTVE